MTLRLAVSLSHYWPRIDGQAALSGVDLLDLPLDRLVSAVYHWLTREADEDALKKFDLKLWQPIPGQDISEGDDLGPWSSEGETSAFKGLQAALNLKGSSTTRQGDQAP